MMVIISEFLDVKNLKSEEKKSQNFFFSSGPNFLMYN